MTETYNTTTPVKPQLRNEYWDALRGVAIFAVIIIHACGIAFSTRHGASGSINFYSGVVFRQLMAFAVPLFLFISGYWMRNVRISSAADYISFLRKRATKILIPYIVWSFVYLAFSSLISHSIPGLRSILIMLVTGSASAPLYFIILILQFYLLLPLLQLIVNRLRIGVFVIIILNIACLLFIYFLRIVHHFEIPFILYAGLFCNWVIYFCLGLVADRIRLQTPIYMLVGGGILSFLLALGESQYLLSLTGMVDFSTSTIRLGSLLYSVSIILLGLALSRVNFSLPRLWVKVGQYSFGIYFVHMLVLSITSYGLRKIYWLFALQPVSIILLALVTLALSYGIIAISLRVLPREILKTVLAFGI